MSLPPEILQQRYSTIELAYSERRWPEVESLSQGLLAELEPNPTDPLQLRLVLLLGHTRLYGLADPSGARRYYESVLDHCEESTLRDIAQQGLAHCAQAAEQQSATTGAATPWLDDGETTAAVTTVGATASQDASPWLAEQPEAGPASGSPPEPEPAAEVQAKPPVSALLPDSAAAAPARDTTPPAPGRGQGSGPEALAELAMEIVDEPEQIAVAQADPLRRQELELEELAADGPRDGDSGSDDEPRDLSADQLDDLSRGLLRLRLS